MPRIDLNLSANTSGRITLHRQEGWRIAGRALGEAAATLQGLMDAAADSGYRMVYKPQLIDSIMRSSQRVVADVGGYIEGTEDTVEIGHDLTPDGTIRMWARLKGGGS